MRNVILTDEFKEFFEELNTRTQEKIRYAIEIVQEIQNLNNRLAKKLQNTDFYELRISTENQYRIILFTIDNENIALCKDILFLCAFLKKDTKDYKKNIERANKILQRYASTD